MKKMLRIAAALAALLAMTNFIGCKNDDDDDGDVAVTDVKITSTVTEVKVGETITLTAEVLPADATNKTVTWTSSDTAIATVDSTGKVTGVAAGTAKITAKAGEKTDVVDVTVKAAATSGGETGGSTGGTTGGETGGSTGGETTTIAVTEVKITSTVTEVTAGETITLTAEVSPADATDKTVTWTSSDTAIATVDSTGKVTGVAAGTAKITAKAGEKTAAVDVTVKAAVAPSTKLNVSMDVATLVFADVTEGLADTAASDKNGTYMIPASTTILGALTPAKDDKAFWYTDKARTKISALQLNGEGALNFTLSGAATVKVTFLSTGDTNTSAITVNGTANSVTGKTATEFTWEISEAGDYSILSSGTSNARITKLSIVEK